MSSQGLSGSYMASKMASSEGKLSSRKSFEQEYWTTHTGSRTICTDIYVLNFARNSRDVDRDGRRNILHVSFVINTMHI